jgi:hypothetical protein
MRPEMGKILLRMGLVVKIRETTYPSEQWPLFCVVRQALPAGAPPEGSGFQFYFR